MAGSRPFDAVLLLKSEFPPWGCVGKKLELGWLMAL